MRACIIYAGRRIQRFLQSSPRETSYASLGWLRIELFIYVKKLLFIRSVAVLGDDSIYKRIFIKRLHDFNSNIVKGCENVNKSPTFDILYIAIIFGLEVDVNIILTGTIFYTKAQWNRLVWAKAWEIENQDWYIRKTYFRSTKYLKITSEIQGLEILPDCILIIGRVCMSAKYF